MSTKSSGPCCSSRRPSSTHSGSGLPTSTPLHGTANWKMTSRRDAWTRWRTKPSQTCGLAAAPIGEEPGQSQVFGAHYRRLPGDVRRLADESYRLLRRDPKHPSLHFKRIGRFWSVRVGLNYRALAVEREHVMV